MDKSHYDNLQYVFACLSTHSRWMKIIRNNISLLFNYFSLSTEDQLIMRQFLSENSQKILSSAYLSEEKRWREMLLSIKYSLEFIQGDKLKPYWQRYLRIYGIRDKIPVSPIQESIKFLTYLQQQKINKLMRETLRYDLLRNITYIYTFSPDDKMKNSTFKEVKENISLYTIKMNPSLLATQQFSFYKQRKTGKVNMLQLNAASRHALLIASETNHIPAWIERTCHHHKTTPTQCIALLERLYLCDAISFIKINRYLHV